MAPELPVFSEDEHSYAHSVVVQFIDALYNATDVRPFLDPCLGVGGARLCVVNEGQLPEQVVGHLPLDFIPDLTTKKLADAIINLGLDPLVALGGALLNARDIERNGVNERNERGFDVCMTVIDEALRAYFAVRH